MTNLFKPFKNKKEICKKGVRRNKEDLKVNVHTFCPTIKSRLVVPKQV